MSDQGQTSQDKALARPHVTEDVGPRYPTCQDPAERLLKFFTYKHLPEHLREVSARFCILAQWIVDELPGGPERTVALRKLLESKDCAVRARLEEG